MGEGWRLVAGELGYVVGGSYTSLTGFRDPAEDGAGTVQLAALGRLLQHAGFKMWDLGMSMGYKMDLGGVPTPRAEFLSLLHKTRDDQGIVFECREPRNAREIIDLVKPAETAAGHGKQQQQHQQQGKGKSESKTADSSFMTTSSSSTSTRSATATDDADSKATGKGKEKGKKQGKPPADASRTTTTPTTPTTSTSTSATGAPSVPSPAKAVGAAMQEGLSDAI